RHVDEVEVRGGTGTTRPLLPGHYRLSVQGRDLACAMVPFDVRAGQDTRLDVRAEPGAATVIACAVPPEDEREQAVHVVVRTPAGELVFAGDAWENKNPMTLGLSLRPGDYRVEASLGALRATADLA